MTGQILQWACMRISLVLHFSCRLACFSWEGKSVTDGEKNTIQRINWYIGIIQCSLVFVDILHKTLVSFSIRFKFVFHQSKHDSYSTFFSTSLFCPRAGFALFWAPFRRIVCPHTTANLESSKYLASFASFMDIFPKSTLCSLALRYRCQFRSVSCLLYSPQSTRNITWIAYIKHFKLLNISAGKHWLKLPQ